MFWNFLPFILQLFQIKHLLLTIFCHLLYSTAVLPACLCFPRGVLREYQEFSFMSYDRTRKKL